MSFSELRAARAAKDSKGYVKRENSPNPLATKPSQLSSSEDPETATIVLSDGLYTSLPPAMEVRSSRASGRGIWSKAYAKPGDVLISVKPHAAALSVQYLESYCSSCFGAASESGLKRCTRCRVIWYCNSQCQNDDWPSHKLECSALQEWEKAAPSPELSIPSDAIRCLGRVLWRRKKQGRETVWTKEIDAMESHRSSLKPSSFEMHTHFAQGLVRYLGLNSPQELNEFGFSSAGDIVDVISRFVTNTFTVTTPTLTPLGASVSPLAALINHSCDPNAIVVFPRSAGVLRNHEPQLQVIALRNIMPDEEITTTYIDLTLPRAMRQKSLDETYNFSCTCAVCVASDEVDPRESMWCPKSCGGTCSVPTEENSFTRCSQCKAVVRSTDAVLDALRIGQEALDKATKLEFADPLKAQQLTTNLIPILSSAGLTPSSHPLLALTRLHQSLLISSLPSPPTQEHLDDIIRTATKSMTGISSILRPGHPVRGIALAELGKMLAVDEPQPRQAASPAEAVSMYPPSGPPRLKQAYETLIRAREELLVGFGTKNDGGMVGRDVREAIVSLEKELGVWKQSVRNVMEDTSVPSKKK